MSLHRIGKDLLSSPLPPFLPLPLSFLFLSLSSFFPSFLFHFLLSFFFLPPFLPVLFWLSFNVGIRKFLKIVPGSE